jgi:predicted ATP-binding protein involved in virulence
MRVTRLKLDGFRGFQSLELNLDRDITVLVGVNGAGKSSILDALAIMLSRVAAGILTGLPQNGRKIHDADTRTGSGFANIELEASIAGIPVVWNVSHARPRKLRPPTGLTALKALIDKVCVVETAHETSLPLAVYYPVNRAVLDVPVRIRKRYIVERLEAYDQALEAGGRNFRIFFEWFRQREDIENEQNARSKRRRHHVDRQLEAVRSAVERLMPGFSELHVERNPQRMVVRKKGEALAVDQLSDGEKCVLAMVGDLARRLAIVSIEGAQPLDEHAVVLIDEIDLHLHPAWERAVLPRLRRAFPNCQFIVSTHSPHVIATAPRESVIILEDFQAYEPPTPTEGRNVGAILSDVLGVGERPDDVRDALRAIDDALTRGEYVDARRRLDTWRDRLGSDDADVVRLTTMLHFLDGAADANDQEGR